MKVRIGFGLGTSSASTNAERFAAMVDAAERERFDSLWFSERITGSAPDPVVAMAMAAARTTRIKVGMSVMVLPGRNPVVLAKTLSSLDVLSKGRLLPAFGLGAAESVEHQAFGVKATDRSPWFEEALPLLRRLWSENDVSHVGPRFRIEGVTVKPKPYQDRLEVWLGGVGPRELRRVGRLSDGWLPSFRTPEQVAAGRQIVEQAADEAGRSIDPEHFGALIPYRANGAELTDLQIAGVKKRNPDVDPTELFPTLDQIPALIERFIAVGFSKFVVVPTVEPEDWDEGLGELAALVRPLEN